MADVTDDQERLHAATAGTRFLMKFEEDTLRERPLWIRLIIEFLGTFLLVTVAAGSGVINHYVGVGPISRTVPHWRSLTYGPHRYHSPACSRPSSSRPNPFTRSRSAPIAAPLARLYHHVAFVEAGARLGNHPYWMSA